MPRVNLENKSHFVAQGLTRYVVEPRDHHPITFGRGSLQVELEEDELSWVVSLGPQPTADLLAEMVAALVYHYDPDGDGGTAITDIAVNDGDFVAKRRGSDGGFEVRLTAAPPPRKGHRAQPAVAVPGPDDGLRGLGRWAATSSGFRC